MGSYIFILVILQSLTLSTTELSFFFFLGVTLKKKFKSFVCLVGLAFYKTWSWSFLIVRLDVVLGRSRLILKGPHQHPAQLSKEDKTFIFQPFGSFFKNAGSSSSLQGLMETLECPWGIKTMRRPTLLSHAAPRSPGGRGEVVEPHQTLMPDTNSSFSQSICSHL